MKLRFIAPLFVALFVLSCSGDVDAWTSSPGGAGFPYLGEYGDGSDGAVTFDGSTAVAGTTRAGSVYTLNRDVMYASATINAGVSVCQCGWRLFAGTTLNIAATGAITNDGATATTFTGAVGGSDNTVGSGANGGASGANGAGPGNSSTALASALGGKGGNGGTATNAGGTAGALTPPATSSGTWHTAMVAETGSLMGGANAQTIYLFAIQVGSGGGGGGGALGTSVGGGGGGGGGYLLVAANTITNNGTMHANGGNGAAGAGTTASGGGGGGGGGVVYVVSHTLTGGGTVAANGGTGGAGSFGGGAGANGLSGSVFFIQN